jgi:hypothetical protein
MGAGVAREREDSVTGGRADRESEQGRGTETYMLKT